ncbi:VOC family protein [Myxacorys almedinensis]|uniref:VOC family protein n=1 Tax=Myxacorys almedinensis A TaxID=2690445 RepID=A0A8J8CGQ1_9CYAN|nr:VOC family protein [Myxacorys almedinensis]NDJ15829.1 VOC family protein [Myxacorys almedinensis A]
MNIKRALVAIAAADFERSSAFYRQIFQREPTVYAPGSYAEFQVEGLRVGLYNPRASEARSLPYPLVSLCLEVERLEDAIAHLTSLGYPPPGAILSPSHGREIYAYDPDGNRIILYQPAKTA